MGFCDFSVSPSPFGLDFGTLDFGLGLDNYTVQSLDISRPDFPRRVAGLTQLQSQLRFILHSLFFNSYVSVINLRTAKSQTGLVLDKVSWSGTVLDKPLFKLITQGNLKDYSRKMVISSVYDQGVILLMSVVENGKVVSTLYSIKFFFLWSLLPPIISTAFSSLVLLMSSLPSSSLSSLRLLLTSLTVFRNLSRFLIASRSWPFRLVSVFTACQRHAVIFHDCPSRCF